MKQLDRFNKLLFWEALSHYKIFFHLDPSIKAFFLNQNCLLTTQILGVLRLYQKPSLLRCINEPPSTKDLNKSTCAVFIQVFICSAYLKTVPTDIR